MGDSRNILDMSPEAQLIWYLIALIAFVAGAILSAWPWTSPPNWNLFACIGLVCLTVVPFWVALQAV